MNKRQRLGQHFLISKKIAQTIVDSAHLTKHDTVLEVGTGEGILTKLLCDKAKNVISVDADKKLYQNAISVIDLENLELRYGDGFKIKDKFTVFVSNLPYSKSKKAVEWLVQQNFSHAIIMVQKEFAEKLITSTPSERKAVSVIADYSFDIKKILKVGKNNFNPPPKVDSIVLELVKKKTLSEEIIKTINRIFSYRRKTLQNVFKQFDKTTNDQRRLDDITGDEIIKIAKQIIKK